MMIDPLSKPCTAFNGNRLLAQGTLIDVALSVRNILTEEIPAEQILTFDDRTGRVIDLDLRGSEAEIRARLSAPPQPSVSRRPRPATMAAPITAPEEPRGRGRPKLGVVAREVTMLPRHWEWLAAQPGGASVALRKLVEEAKRDGNGAANQRQMQEAAYRFMNAKAGDLPGFEEATRALFAGNQSKFEEQIADWPEDIRAYVLQLAFGP